MNFFWLLYKRKQTLNFSGIFKKLVEIIAIKYYNKNRYCLDVEHYFLRELLSGKDYHGCYERELLQTGA